MSDDEIELGDELLEAASGGLINLPTNPRTANPNQPLNYSYNSTIYY
jgi:hypothetical protein